MWPRQTRLQFCRGGFQQFSADPAHRTLEHRSGSCDAIALVVVSRSFQAWSKNRIWFPAMLAAGRRAMSDRLEIRSKITTLAIATCSSDPTARCGSPRAERAAQPADLRLSPTLSQ
jgi:hypothetical protein